MPATGGELLKDRVQYVCQACGSSSPRWMGRCPGCGSFNTMVEEKVQADRPRKTAAVSTDHPVLLDQVRQDAAIERRTTGIPEVDRVLGGGVVPGALILLGGDPGIGKSTLMLQVASLMSRDGPVLYATAEESAQQTRLRAERLGVGAGQLFLMDGTDLDAYEEALRSRAWRACVVDSLQTVADSALESAPGSVSQVREVAGRIMRVAKSAGIPVFLIGHVNKEGSIAGPRVVEHLVDVVLMFEGDRQHLFRMLRGVKNRFGATSELGLFHMAQEGLVAVDDPSRALLAERPRGAPGSAIAAVLEGSRPMLVEVQALVSRAVGMPRRVVTGIDAAQAALVLAVLERHAGQRLHDRDVYIKITGGVDVEDPAVDLACALAVVSSRTGIPIPDDWVLAGELGLTGEVRRAPRMQERLREAAQLGVGKALVPYEGAAALAVVPVWRIGDAIRALGVGSGQRVEDPTDDDTT
ncbi:MAG: DNA repair protein RadA [Clostridia bacterium]